MTMAAELTLNITTTKVHCHRRSWASSINLPFSPSNSLKLFSDFLIAFLGVQMPLNISVCMPVSQITATWPANCSVLAVIILTTAGDLYTHIVSSLLYNTLNCTFNSSSSVWTLSSILFETNTSLSQAPRGSDIMKAWITGVNCMW